MQSGTIQVLAGAAQMKVFVLAFACLAAISLGGCMVGKGKGKAPAEEPVIVEEPIVTKG